MSDECIFCSSDQVHEEFPGVIRCRACWRIEVKAGLGLEEEYEGGHWFEGGSFCLEHEFVDTGTKRSWCKKCDTDATFVIEKGEYVANDDIELFQRLSETFSKGNP